MVALEAYANALIINMQASRMSSSTQGRAGVSYVLHNYLNGPSALTRAVNVVAGVLLV